VRQLLALGAVAVSLTLIGPAVSTARSAASGPCGTASVSSVNYTHVLWIWMENHSYNKIIGSSSAPYINSLATACGLATNYHNITHPSLPNYIGATSGLALSALSPFLGDCMPKATCSTNAPSIFGETSSWKAYEETMPKNCYPTNSGYYYVRHNPPPYYTSLSNCSTNDVPYTQLANDLSSGKLPAFSFVTPNAVDDMHNGTVAQGDTWLSKNVPTILNSSAYKTGTLAVFITWDEGSGGTAGANCATNTTDKSCHVATLVISPSTKVGTKSSLLFNHYSLLLTTETLLKLSPLGLAAKATSMATPFNL
jgi:phosphatidylinositol-3-phosphatase